MALRKPLVIVSGQVQQLQAGDTLSAPTSETSVVEMVNEEAVSALAPGNAVYISSAGNVKLADKGAAGTKSVLGLAIESITASATGEIATNGILTLSTGAWDAVTGETGGLAAGKKYYLGDAGALEEETPTAEAGEYVVEVGIAISTTEMKIEPRSSILL